MSVVCYIDSERLFKTKSVLKYFAYGCGGQVVNVDRPEPGFSHHVIMGQWAQARKLIRDFRKRNLDFWYVDNAWVHHHAARHYRITRNGLSPRFLPGKSIERAANIFNVRIKPWRTTGSYVLVCLSSKLFGSAFGLDQDAWLERLNALLPTVTDRQIVIRSKPKSVKQARPEFVEALRDAWCLVTHSSGAAVEAALAGIPVFCEPTCGAFMVGTNDYSRIENPIMPDNREEWIASLCWQQFSGIEMKQGMAWNLVREVEAMASAAA